jgi:hypothetical protein
MKTPGFLFTTIGCTVLMQGLGYADPSGATVSDHKFGSSLPVDVVCGGFMGNKTVNNHAPPVVPFTGPSFKNERNQGSNLAIIGGPATSNSKHSLTAINGTEMKRKF